MKSAAKLEMSDATDGLSSQDRCRLLEAPPQPTPTIVAAAFIDLSSSESDSEGEIEDGLMESDEVEGTSKRRKSDGKMMASLPPGFLDPLPSAELLIRAPQLPRHQPVVARPALLSSGSRQFWKAGDFEGVPAAEDSVQPSMGIDHVRVHPKFLHSNATSHKWALGAVAELLDNALDEVCNGATFVNIDMLLNKKDESRMLLIEDNGGGMDPDKMRQCMSLGYSSKNKIANCIGQYGNGFKNSTMRLGADVIVFSQCSGKQGKSIIQSIGMLSYTYLRNTGKEDVVVPMNIGMLSYTFLGNTGKVDIDILTHFVDDSIIHGGNNWAIFKLHYEKRGTISEKLMWSSVVDWNKNVDTIVQWSPYLNEDDLLQQFNSMSDHGTRILIYNLWEDDQGKLELDFDADKFDIQISGFNRDEKRIQMAKQFPNSKHFFTYRHSLRSYASILYLRLPHAFRMILRGKEIEHHNIVNDMILKQEVTYHPNTGSDGIPKYSNMVAVITIGFVKDAKHHVNFHGFNVYHKNRLIKPFWRVWNAAGSHGRGVIGVLEANFVEPTHDKQGFERTIVLSRLETRLVQMQKAYWSTNCHKIGYAPRCNKRCIEAEDNDETSPKIPWLVSSLHPVKSVLTNKLSKDSGEFQGKYISRVSKKGKSISSTESSKGVRSSPMENGSKNVKEKPLKSTGSSCLGSHSMPSGSTVSDPDSQTKGEDVFSSIPNASALSKFSDKETSCLELQETFPNQQISGGTRSLTKEPIVMPLETIPDPEAYQLRISLLEDENEALKQRIKSMDETILLEKRKNKSLIDKVEDTEKKLEELNKEQEALIDIFAEERNRRDEEEANLRKRLKEAQDEIHDLLKLASNKCNSSSLS